MFINGEWTMGSDNRTQPVHNPADNSVLADFPLASEADCLAAVSAADDAMEVWASTPARERGEILRRAFEIMVEEKDQLTQVIVAENGKAWRDAAAEAAYAAEFFRWFSEEAVRIGGEFRRSPSGDKDLLVTPEPIGVSLLITPWNFPAAMATRKLAPALAAGCTTILKPASETPLTAAYVVDVLNRAGVPQGVVNLILPSPVGKLVGRILQERAVRKLSFTGSTEVGRILLQEAAKTVVSSSMELGGNAPFLVLPEADVDAAVEGAMIAKMRNGGSACTAANRFYVHTSVYEEFSKKLSAAMAATKMGPGTDESNELGALVSMEERDKVAELVSTAVGQGAQVMVGAETPDGGAFYPPTVLRDVSHSMDIAATEIFGPVATLIPFEEIDDAVEMANDTDLGLIAYVYGNLEDGLATARQLEAGMVAVNRAVLSDPAAPFGGIKQSGLGREGGFEGIDEFLETKLVGINPIN